MSVTNFYVAHIEGNDDLQRSLSNSHRHCGNEIFLLTSGYIIRNCDFNDIRLNDRDIHLSLSRQVTSVSEFSPSVKGYYCCFSDEFIKQIYMKENVENDLEFISSFLFRYPLRLNKKIFNHIEYLFDALLKLDFRCEPDKSLMQVYLTAVIYEIKKLMIESGLDFYPSKAFLITKKYNDLLTANVGAERSVDFYARQLDITPNHLNKSVKAVTGRTAITVLNEMSIQEAKMQLRYTSLSISDIAFQLGFEDLSYFSRFFKKTTGMTPMEYRRNL